MRRTCDLMSSQFDEENDVQFMDNMDGVDAHLVLLDVIMEYDIALAR